MSFTFGTPTTTAANNAFGGFGAQKPATTGFSLGTTPPTFGATTAPSNLSFGGAAVPATTSTLNFSFGSNAPAQTQAQTTGFALGTPSTSTPSLFGATTAGGTTSTGLTFGTPAATSTAPTLSFAAPASTAPPLFGAQTGGLFGKPTVAATPIIAPTTTTAASRGLGGLDATVGTKGLSQGGASPTAAKENLLPNELVQTIDSFKDFVKTQKTYASDIARGSARPLNRCAEDTASLMEILTTLAGSVQRDRSLADKLKHDTAKALQNAEIAQRTHDTPPGLQYENNAPLHFFMELSDNFEHDLMLFRSQIEATEKHIQTMVAPKTLTPQELTLAMSKLHDSLVAVAGRLQGVHSKVQQQKEQYLNFRKYVLKDNTNVFEDVKSNSSSFRSNKSQITSGPTPFGPGSGGFLSSTTFGSPRPPNYGTPNPLAWGNPTPLPSTTNIAIGTAMRPPTASLNFNPPSNLTAPLSTTDANSSFQLQKPPFGNKRGKH